MNVYIIFIMLKLIYMSCVFAIYLSATSTGLNVMT